MYPITSTAEIEVTVNRTAEEVDFKSCHNGKENNSGVSSSTKSVAICHKCGKYGHMKRDYKFNRNGFDGDLYKR